MLQLSYRLSDRIIVHNETGREVLIQQFRQDASHVRVIPHGAYSTGQVHKPAYPPFDSLRLLAFGSIRENKGLHLAIGAVQKVASSSSIPVRLTVAGGVHNAAEEQYWHRCQELIATKPDGIEVIARHIEDSEVGPLLARHHAVLLPYMEFFSESGVANLALSHDRPILATAAGGAGELIEQSVCGIPIAAPSVEAVATAISLAMQLGSERLRKMGIAGGEFIRKTRSWDAIAQQTAELYSQMANIHADAPPKEADVFAAD
jgi:glycosyltransferase involved in cell wall biosynthesis